MEAYMEHGHINNIIEDNHATPVKNPRSGRPAGISQQACWNGQQPCWNGRFAIPAGQTVLEWGIPAQLAQIAQYPWLILYRT